MAVKLDQFDLQGTVNGIDYFKRDVKTPQPANEDGSGYQTEDNLQAVYRVNGSVIKVSKVSNRGWSVWQYAEGSGEIQESLGRGLNAVEAQRLARRRAEEL